MTGDQSRQFQVGDRVCWHADKNDLGTVTEANWAGVTIKWDNRSVQTILHNDMAVVSVGASTLDAERDQYLVDVLNDLTVVRDREPPVSDRTGDHAAGQKSVL
jgi:hypothetical protein